MIKVAIFGGSFDPPHKGHQRIVQRAIEILDIDKLIILPAFLNPFKEYSFASARQRLEWCHRLFDPIEDVEVSDFEISLGRAIYTSESLRYLGKQYDIRYIIIGSDNLALITRWHEFEWINSHFTWVIAERRGDHKDTQMLQSWIDLKIDMPISSTDIREGGDLMMIDERIKKELDILLKKGKDIMTIDERVERIITQLDNKKAEEIEVFDLDNIDYIAKRVIIANSLGGKHTEALYHHLKNELKPHGEEFLGADESSDWVVADLGDILIHIMTPEYRQKYSLESFLSELQHPKE